MSKLDLIIKETLKFLRASLPSSIEIRSRIETKGMLLADPGQIHQVIMNLCANASQAMSNRAGIVEVSLNEMDFGSQDPLPSPELQPEPYLKLTVTDTGCGMSQEVMERIFDPFFTTKKPGEGTGLGLAVVHGIVKEHGGVILVSSTPGKGTSFEIFFPWLKESQDTLTTTPDTLSSLSTLETQGSPLPSTGCERILLVDDEEPIAYTEKVLLEKREADPNPSPPSG